MWRSASRTLPRGRSRFGRWSLAGFIITSATSIAAKLSALIAETGRHTPEGDDHAGDRRAGDPRRVHQDAVEADRVDDPVGADDLDHERLPGGIVDREHEAAESDHREHHPRLDGAEGGQGEEQHRGDRHSGLGDDQELALVEAVGERAAEGTEEEDPRELQGGGEADGEAGARQSEDEPELGDDLHPVAGQGDDLPAEVEAVIADLEGCEGAVEGGAQARPSSSTCSRISAARAKVATSSSGSSRILRAR